MFIKKNLSLCVNKHTLEDDVKDDAQQELKETRCC